MVTHRLPHSIPPLWTLVTPYSNLSMTRASCGRFRLDYQDASDCRGGALKDTYP